MCTARRGRGVRSQIITSPRAATDSRAPQDHSGHRLTGSRIHVFRRRQTVRRDGHRSPQTDQHTGATPGDGGLSRRPNPPRHDLNTRTLRQTTGDIPIRPHGPGPDTHGVSGTQTSGDLYTNRKTLGPAPLSSHSIDGSL